jgi:hypothetical protein
LISVGQLASIPCLTHLTHFAKHQRIPTSLQWVHDSENGFHHFISVGRLVSIPCSTRFTLFFKTRMYPDLAIDSVLDLAHSFCKYEPIPTSLGVHNSKNNFRYSIYVWTARIDRADSPHFFCKHERILTSPGGRNSKTDFRCSSPLDYSSLFANTIYFYKVNVSCVY